MLQPFDENEMEAVYVIPGPPNAPDRTIWKSPITPRENLLNACGDKSKWMFLANEMDERNFNCKLIKDNIARGMAVSHGVSLAPNPQGEEDAFGVIWIFDNNSRGAMVKPGTPKLLDIDKWEEIITFPNPDEWDWKKEAIENKDYLSSDLFARKATIFTGFFERLISWMDFEEAAIALIDEDSKDVVHNIFSHLAELYSKYADHFKHDFDIDIVEIHDDWGSQKAPFFSYETVREMIIPHLKKFCDHVHSLGMYVQLHSCGKIDQLVPLMIEAGIDIWMGQNLNDKKTLIREYGDRIVIECEAPSLGNDATDEEVWEAAKKWADDYIVPGKPIALSPYSATYPNTPFMTEALYRISRMKLFMGR